jgi:hypothetical protein
LTSTDFKLKRSAYLDFHTFESFDFDSLPYQVRLLKQQTISLVLFFVLRNIIHLLFFFSHEFVEG